VGLDERLGGNSRRFAKPSWEGAAGTGANEAPVELAPSPDLVRPWRKATVVASTIAALELVLLVAAGIALLGRDLAHRTRTAAPARHAPASRQHGRPAPAAKPAGKPTLARSAVSVLVLNGNGRAGAAATEARAVGVHGYRVARVGNAPGNGHTRTVVMYRPGYRAEAERLAHDAGISVVGPLDGLTPAALGRAQLTVVVGDE